MPSYKLTYFNIRGYAEPIRIIFAAAGVPYEDVRIELKDWPTEVKQICPFGQIPILEVDGRIIAQSKVISRFLCKEHGMLGKDSWEEVHVDMIVEQIYDLGNALRPLFMEQDPQKKEEISKKIQDETVPKYLGYLEDILKKNGGGEGYFVGDSLTWADITMANALDWLNGFFPAAFDNFPVLFSLIQRVRGLPRIAEWLANRPQTPY